jgi:transcriptional regulator with XRE-family HTH domain
MGTMTGSLHTAENKRLIVWLKGHREAQKLTMRQLAEKLGVPHSYVGKIEQAERRLDVAEYLTYCEALGVSPIDGLKVINPDL